MFLTALFVIGSNWKQNNSLKKKSLEKAEEESKTARENGSVVRSRGRTLPRGHHGAKLGDAGLGGGSA